MSTPIAKLLLAAAIAGTAGAAGAATVYSENFTGASANLKWRALDSACLTAGNGIGSIPSCRSRGLPTDAVGQGALLLTPAADGKKGAILSAFDPFPLSQGIRITFTTYTYGGDSGGNSGNRGVSADNGADGISFFITSAQDAGASKFNNMPDTAGGTGGSLGYSCSNHAGNVNDGMANAYLGIGIDEYGNFLNSGDNTDSGVGNSKYQNSAWVATHGSNGFYSDLANDQQFQPMRIGLRGAGNTNFNWLNAQNSKYYSRNLNVNQRAAAVLAACTTGKYITKGSWTNNQYQNYSDPNPTVVSLVSKAAIDDVLNPGRYLDASKLPGNYRVIADGYRVLPGGRPCAQTDRNGACAQWGPYNDGTQLIANNSPTATRNPGARTPQADIAWPITYRLTISAKGILNFAYSYNNGAYQPIVAGTNIVTSNGALPKSLRFGFSAGTGDHNNRHEITCFSVAPLQSNSSVSTNTLSGQVSGDTQIFLAVYTAENWWGSVMAAPILVQDGQTPEVSPISTWDASCRLTGGGCDSMGLDDQGTATNSFTAIAPDTRKLFTWQDKGQVLTWENLTTSLQGLLNQNRNGVIDGLGSQRLAWLRGDRSNETDQTTTGKLRSRTSVLGDIINSSPVFVGAPKAEGFSATLSDALYPSAQPEAATGAQKYSTFLTANAGRMNVVYVGANDGYLHGFRAGKLGADGKLDQTLNDGVEVFGYMPGGVLRRQVVNLSDPLYTHDYLVDATPGVGNVFYGGAWHTWLAGGTGSNGNEVYILDVTDPVNFSAANVIGDWDNTDPSLTSLGHTVGSPAIARMHNGQWAVLMGNGLVTGKEEGVYIGLVDPTSGAVTVKFLGTGAGTSTGTGGTDDGPLDGIAQVSVGDIDGDGVADYLYAGDLHGNVWRFDVTDQNAANWKASTFGGTTAQPLFVATDDKGNPKPITTRIEVMTLTTGTALNPRVMLYFGSGRQKPQTGTSATQYARGDQTFYGIWDWDMTNWNAIKGSVQRASLARTDNAVPIARANLLEQTVEPPPDASDVDHRYLDTEKSVCWKGDSGSLKCDTYTQYGWRFKLPDNGGNKSGDNSDNANQNEQIIYNPAIIEGAVVVNTMIPPFRSAAQCNPGLQRGWTMAFNPATGGGFPDSYFADANGVFDDAIAGNSVSGTRVSGVGTPIVIKNGDKQYLVTQTVLGSAVVIPINLKNPKTTRLPKRVSWREVVNP